MKYFSIIALALVFITTGCEGSDFTQATITSGFSGRPQKITLYDQTHRMEMGNFLLPSDWQFNHEIATKTDAAGFNKYFKEAIGPKGELITNLPLTMFYPQMGTNFDGSFQEAVSQTVGRITSNARFGQMKKSPEAMSTTGFQKASERAPGLQAMELPFEATHNGRTVQGMIYIMLADHGQFGFFYGDILIASPSDFASAKETLFMTINSYEENEAYVRTLEQKHQHIMARQQQMAQARSQQSALAHQQRMAMRQQSFNAHQSRMQANSQMMDQSYNSFMNNLNTPSTYNSGSSYSSHNAYIDAVHERQTFNDPYSGQEVHKDGVYDYNYTNGLGDYYRTNDPSFNQHSLQGDWQQIDPNSPN